MEATTKQVQFGDPRLPQRFWAKCEPEPNSGCWLWTAGSFTDGYGGFWWTNRVHLAHRVAYGVLVRPVPHGLQLDHIVCDNTKCVNPAHVRESTVSENTSRGMERLAFGHLPSTTEYSRKKRVARGKAHQLSGCCSKCGAIRGSNKWYCDPCNSLNNARIRERYRRRKESINAIAA